MAPTVAAATVGGDEPGATGGDGAAADPTVAAGTSGADDAGDDTTTGDTTTVGDDTTTGGEDTTTGGEDTTTADDGADDSGPDATTGEETTGEETTGEETTGEESTGEVTTGDETTGDGTTEDPIAGTGGETGATPSDTGTAETTDTTTTGAELPAATDTTGTGGEAPATGTGGEAPATGTGGAVEVPDETLKPKAYECPRGMARVHRRGKPSEDGTKTYKVFCVDRREFGGGRPRTEISFYGAKAACERKGKRLCTGLEWRTGCGGRKYPYGSTYDPIMCNTMSMAGEERPVVSSGYYRRCRSPWGLYDMVGNVGEWTADGKVRGGDSYRTADIASCRYSRRRSPGSQSRLVGFRCCADATVSEKDKDE